MANRKTKGYITIDGEKAPGLLVQVVDVDAAGLIYAVLGTKTTDADGYYEVSYDPEKYKSFELDPLAGMREENPDIQLRAIVPFMNFLSYELASPKIGDVTQASLRLDWDIPRAALGLSPNGVLDLIKKLKDTIPETRQRYWTDVKNLLQSLFDQIQQRLENFQADETPAKILRETGDSINQTALDLANSIRRYTIVGKK